MRDVAVSLPLLLCALGAVVAAPSQQIALPAITVAGEGRDTYVLMSGMVGGTAGFRRVGALLVAQGKRVVTVDPYGLSIDSSDVSFDALARRVDQELGARGVTDAKVVGHAHGGGVALRLAANAPHRVRELVLLDVGALAINRSTVFSSTIRIVPFITRLPRGKSFVRSRFLAGLRENSGRTEWLDDSTTRAYTEPMLANIGRVVAMALRLANAPEPEPLGAVVARIRMPVTLLLAELKRGASPGAEELSALAPLGSLVQIDTLAGVGHFLHEEAPAEVVGRLLRSRQAMAAAVARGAP